MARKRNKKHNPEWLQKLKLNALVITAAAYIGVLRLTCRIEVVAGQDHLDAVLTRGVVVPCTWHQQIITSALFLRPLMRRGFKTGFLISPSREGEFITRVAQMHGTQVMRGSSSRTGSEALRATIRAIKQGISPTMYADGPRGPAQQLKPGTVILAQRTQTPIMAIGTAASRYWQLKSWDKNRIPKPFSRLTIAVGELRLIERGEQQLDAVAGQIGDRIDQLTATAEAAQQKDRA